MKELLGKGLLVVTMAGMLIATAPVETAAAAAYGDNQTYITAEDDDRGTTRPPKRYRAKGTSGAGDDDG
jgi:hypothetical protein